MFTQGVPCSSGVDNSAGILTVSKVTDLQCQRTAVHGGACVADDAVLFNGMEVGHLADHTLPSSPKRKKEGATSRGVRHGGQSDDGSESPFSL